MNEKPDLPNDWPADVANEELARLAQQLPGAVPPLPPEALSRVQQRVQAQLDLEQGRQRRRRLVFGWSIAAAILVALCSYAYLRTGRDAASPSAHDGKTKEAPGPGLIEDRIRVIFGESAAAPTAGRPLVRLDENRSLFAD